MSLIITLITVISCDVIDLTPANIIPNDIAFGDAQRIEAAVFGVYESAQRGFYLGVVQRGYPFGAASTQQGDMKGEDMYNDQQFYEITYTNAWNPNTDNNNGMWISLYRLINRCNIVKEGVEGALSNGIISQELADQYIGEMLFMRALSHHELLVHFSRPYSDNPQSLGVPYRTLAIDDGAKVPNGEAVARGTVESDYNQLLSDLDQAEQLLPATGGTVYRASRGAAIALKSRIKLHMKDFLGVITEYNKLTTMYSLTESPETPFTNYTSSENIFSLQNSEASNAGVNGALVNMYGDPTLGGRGLVKISPVIWRESFWVQDDLRRELLTRQSATGIFTYKYRAYGVFDEPTPLIRYAEVVLNAAEAYARQTSPDLTEAVSLLNSVRDRALPDGEPSHTVASLIDQNGVLDAIWKERRIEFLAEGRRWSDIHRLSGDGLMGGIPLKAQSRSVTNIGFYSDETPLTLDHSLDYSSNLFIWPIPLVEMLNNSGLADAQNPGY